MYTSTFSSPFPLRFMQIWYSGKPEVDVAQKSNQWAARNYTRWINAEYNKLFDQVRTETDATKASQVWMQLNEMVINSYVTIPLIDRKDVAAKAKALQGPQLTPF